MHLHLVHSDPALAATIAAFCTALGYVFSESDTLKPANIVMIDDSCPIVDTVTVPHIYLGHAPTGSAPLLKPFRLATLAERLHALTTEEEEGIQITEHCLFFKHLRVLDTPHHANPTAMTEKESELLVMLLLHEGEVLSRDALLTSIWGYSEDTLTHTLETHLYRLRQKLKMFGAESVIESVEGGYTLHCSRA